MHVCVFVSVCMCMCVCECVYVYVCKHNVIIYGFGGIFGHKTYLNVTVWVGNHGNQHISQNYDGYNMVGTIQDVAHYLIGTVLLGMVQICVISLAIPKQIPEQSLIRLSQTGRKKNNITLKIINISLFITEVGRVWLLQPWQLRKLQYSLSHFFLEFLQFNELYWLVLKMEQNQIKHLT